ncbi:MAG: hypothetical protein IJV70_07035 [Clostridia bacterium]|nr:hypothetical protein [Clostridia bacterium]
MDTANISSILSIAFAAIMLLCVAGAFLFGKLNAKFRCATIIAAAALAFLATLIFKANVATETVLNNLILVLQNSGETQFASIAAQLSSVAETLLSVTGAALAPIIFLAFFIVFSVIAFVLSVIVWLFKAIVYSASEKKKKNGAITRLVTGAVSGLVVAFCLLVPIAAYGEIAAIALPELEANGVIEENTEEINSTVASVNESLPVSIFKKAGGSLVVNSLTRIDIKDDTSVTKVQLSIETENIAKLYSHISSLSGKEISQYSEAEAEAITAIGDDLASSKLISKLAGELIYTATDAWQHGETFIGIEKPSLGETFDPVFDEIVNISHDDAQNVTYLGEDITTIAHLVSEFAKAGLFAKLDAEPSELLNTLTSDGVIEKIISELNHNARMKRLIPVVSNIGFKLIGDTIGIPETKVEVYDDMMSTVATKLNDTATLPEPERIETIADMITSATADAGMNIEETEARILAAGLSQYFEDDNMVTPEEVTQFFSEVSDAMSSEEGSSTEGIAYKTGAFVVKLNGNGSKKDAAGFAAKLLKQLHKTGAIENETERNRQIEDAIKSSPLFENIPEDVKESIQGNIIEKAQNADFTASESSLDNISALASSETATEKITSITMSDIKFDPDDYMNSSASAEDLTNTMVNVFTSASSIVNSLNGSEEDGADKLSSMTTALGGILDALSSSDSYGKDKAHNLFAAVVTSSIVTDSTGLSKEDTFKIVEGTKDIENYTGLVGTMTQMGNVVSGMQNSKVNADDLVSLIKNLDKTTVVLIDSLVTADTIEGFGIGAENSEDAAKLVHKLFSILADINDESTFENEANAVKHLLDLATSASDLGDANTAFGANGALSCTATEFLDYVYGSVAVRQTFEYSKSELGVNPFSMTLNAEDTDVLVNACDSFKASHANSEGFIQSVYAFFGL